MKKTAQEPIKNTKKESTKNTVKNTITNIILWPLSIFILLFALMFISDSVAAGVLFLLAAVLANPIFLKFLRNHHIQFKKRFYIPAVVLIWCFGIVVTPGRESDNSAQTQSESNMIPGDDMMSDSDMADDTDADADTDQDSVVGADRDLATNTDTVNGSDVSAENVSGINADTDNNPDTASVPETKTSSALSDLSIHFIDVGQGDATLIVCDGHSMLIDAGDNTKGTTIQLYLSKQGVKKLDYLVLTHPDADHIGGADVIITKFDIDHIFMTDYPEDTKTYKEVLDALKQKSESWSAPAVGDEFVLGDATFTVLAPLNTYGNSNDSSIALMLCHGDNKFLFTGDCSENAEDDLIAGTQNLSADVYQVGHHGSRYSSSQALMDAVSPTYAVVSCGENNSYGHPSAEVLNRLRAMGIQVFRTDEQGSIVATSDGTDITWNCAPSDTWKAGESTMSASASAQNSSANVTGSSSTGNSSKQAAASAGSAAASNTQDASTTDHTSDSDTQSSDSTDAASSGAASSGGADSVPSGDTGSGTSQFETGTSPGAGLYIGNKNNGKLHRSTCHKLPKNENQAIFDTREEAVAAGYDDPCKLCKP